MKNKIFNEAESILKLSHYLPTQTPLKDFIHHNSLHAFQDLNFYDAIFKASKIFGYQATLSLFDFRNLYKTKRINDCVLNQKIIESKGNEHLTSWKILLIDKSYDNQEIEKIGKLRKKWGEKYKINLDNFVHPILFRLLSNYLDQGIALNSFSSEGLGFLKSIKKIEENSFSHFLKSIKAKKLLFSENTTIKDLLKILVGNENFYEQYLFDQQFAHAGWSGMVSVLEKKPESLFENKTITLHDLIFFELLLEIDVLESEQGSNFYPLCNDFEFNAVEHNDFDLFADEPISELDEVLKIWQNAFEWTYYDEVLNGITISNQKIKLKNEEISFQSVFCLDERECSLRRHLEFLDKNCQTYSCPGFFGVEFYYQAENAKFYDKLCPAPVNPTFLVKEIENKSERKHDLTYSNSSNNLFSGYLSSFILGFLTAFRMIQNLFFPKMSPAISSSKSLMNKKSSLIFEYVENSEKENGLQIGFTIEEMSLRVFNLLSGIGLTSNFSDIVYIIGHGSSSANNPHHGAHDCGACSGRPGAVNARVFALMSNHVEVRKQLNKMGIQISEKTRFISGMHDTASDEIIFYDDEKLEICFNDAHLRHKLIFEDALDINSKERSRRFSSINTKSKIKSIRKAIKLRSASLFEPRPELGHGTNSLCIVAKRELTKGLFLDRRAFLNSYDYKTDLNGDFLVDIMKPLGPVCGGINLEYYFSRVDNNKLGAGTKLPHNVVGLIGVSNGCDGDLRPGLPWQMIEVHDPLRLMIIVEHYPEIVLKTIKSTPEMYQWFINKWVHLVSIHPETSEFYYFNEGEFKIYKPLNIKIKEIKNFNVLIEEANEMETNYISDATKENLPIYLLKS
jgi:uncharacterized protein YbcC (UPF0753/DUF2309 family)